MIENLVRHPEDLLLRSVIFSCHQAGELDALMHKAKRKRLPDKAVIFNQGDPGRWMYAILDGAVKISTASEEGKEIVFGILGTGDFFGEISLLDGRPRSATASVLGGADLLVIERSDFLSSVRSNPDIALNLLHAFACRLRATDALIEDCTFLNLPEKLARRLLILARTCGKDTPEGVRIGIKLSQQEIANLVGATRESINKLLCQWDCEGIVRCSGKHLVIIGAEKLERIARDSKECIRPPWERPRC